MKVKNILKAHRIRAEWNRFFNRAISIGKYCSIGKRNYFKITDSGSIEIGDCFSTNDNVLLQASNNGSLHIHDNVFVNRNTSIVALNNIEIGDGATIGQNVVIVDHDHNFRGNSKYICDSIEIGKNVWIGSNVVILKGACIGDDSVIGAGSVVKGQVSNGTVFYQKRMNVEQSYSIEKMEIGK